MTNIYSRQESAQLLPYPALVEALRETLIEYGQNRIASPERLVVPIKDGGLMLSMPAVADDIAIHKLVNICPANAKVRLPTIHGFVNAFDVRTGVPLFTLDGPTVTGRRTAAVSMLGIKTLREHAPKTLTIIGTGAQAANHVQAVGALFPGARVFVKSTSAEQARAFCEANRQDAIALIPLETDAIPEETEVVITLTTSKTPVYAERASANRLVVGVGAFTPDAAEIAAGTVLESHVYVDDPLGARHEAGDLIQADADWSKVKPLADAIAGGAPKNAPLFFKSVGCAAWDLAACRVARTSLAR